MVNKINISYTDIYRSLYTKMLDYIKLFSFGLSLSLFPTSLTTLPIQCVFI